MNVYVSNTVKGIELKQLIQFLYTHTHKIVNNSGYRRQFLDGYSLKKNIYFERGRGMALKSVWQQENKRVDKKYVVQRKVTNNEGKEPMFFSFLIL